MILSVLSTSGMGNFLQLVPILFAFIFVLILTYFSTKWIAKYQYSMNKNRNLHIIETFRITNNKCIQIIQVGTSYFVIAVCKDTVTLLGKLEQEQLTWMPESEEQNLEAGKSFQEILQKMKKKKEKLPRK